MSIESADYESPFSLNRDMGFSRREFDKLLPRVLSGYTATIENNDAEIQLGEGTIVIHIGEERERRLSDWVRLPILPVAIEFNNVSKQDKSRFLRTFDYATMKGLG